MREALALARTMRALAAVAAVTTVAACGGLRLGSRAADPERPPQATAERLASAAGTIDPVDFYRRMGMIAQGAPLPFIGSVGFVAAARPDSTHVVVALAFATGSLTFRREGELHRADYRVTLTVKQGDAVALRLESSQPVRVTTTRETERLDESVLFQQLLTVSPGVYTLTVVVRDDGAGKSASTEFPLHVPSLGTGTISPPVPVYEAQPRVALDAVPLIVASPRAVATYGRDSTIAFYVEAYGDAGEPAMGMAVQVENVTVWSETVQLHAAGNGLFTAVAQVPVDRIGLGAALVAAWRHGGRDTAKTPVFVGFGDEVAPTTYQDLLSYLRYFRSASRLRDLAAVAPAARGAAWAAFFRETDPTPATRENEALLDYLGRLRQASTFQEDATPGWRTDRGMVSLLLGQPDQIVDPFANDASQRGRALVWEYRSLNLNVEFVRATGVSQWKLTPKSEAEVRAAARRLTGAGN